VVVDVLCDAFGMLYSVFDPFLFANVLNVNFYTEASGVP
jgi:hypothetical protein